MSIFAQRRLPITILLLSRVSTYAHCVESIVATLIFWVCPALSPGMPPREKVQRRRIMRSISIHSVDSSTSTLVDELLEKVDELLKQEVAASEDDHINIPKRNKLGNALVKFSAPIMVPSHSVKPFARRLSLPARRLSESFVTAVATPFRTHVCDNEPPSYFSPIVATEPTPVYPSDTVIQGARATETKIAVEEVDIVCVVETEESPYLPVKKVTKFKRVTRKFKSVLHFRQRSTVVLRP